MPAPKELQDLVARFTLHRDAYQSSNYNEAQLRQEFLDPFLALLGWDVENRQGSAEAYKEVIHEDSIVIDDRAKAPDYSVRIGGVRKFFLEAKKPSVNIKKDIHPAFQLRRYAWSAKLPLSILTDFEELAVYDCRIKPEHTDKASTARILYLTFQQYAEKWDELTGLFSRDAVLNGSFDAFAESTKGKRGTSEVDTAFLAEIESWRTVLSENFALRNPTLTPRELNYAVQATIDRIIFLRICEDRGIEDYGRLRALLTGVHVYDRLGKLFQLADERYNSGLFHFQNEKNRPEPDHLTLGLRLDDSPVRELLRNLYYPHSPYEFSVLPADILGQVYEQFLGKVIRLSEGHRAVVEDKPEVRKAGGVYYTPTYIVDYIVRNTVGILLEDKTPRQVAHLRILDPACGSGSFLIIAYQFLLDWHRDYYVADGLKKHTDKLYRAHTGDWRLVPAERKRILLNNIFGVDVDPQAVEVTKLSLLLKVLEGETSLSITTQLQMFHQRALPDLANNIKCGNSLVAPDFYDGQLSMDFFEEESRHKVNVFDWRSEFPKIMRAGGFDAVIGNPPYFSIDDTWGKGDPRLSYLKRAYSHVYNDKTDVLFYFLAKAVQLSRSEVGFIVSRAFLEAYKADKLRGSLAQSMGVRQVIDFRNFYVFEKVGITTAVVLLSKQMGRKAASVFKLRQPRFKTASMISELEQRDRFELLSVPQKNFGSDPWSFADNATSLLHDRLDAAGDPLGSVLVIGQGMQTGRNDVFGRLTRETIHGWGVDRVDSGKFRYYTRARNSDILRYEIKDSGELLLYVEDAPSFDYLPQAVRRHLKSHQARLRSRAAFKRKNCEWWRYTWPLHKEHFHKRRLYCPYLATRNRFALDDECLFLGLTDTTVLYDAEQPEDLRYVLGLLNSKLLTFRFRTIGKLKSGGILEYFENSVSKLPIRRINLQKASDRALHDQMVKLVNEVHAATRRHASARTDHERTSIKRELDSTDRQIDRLVYDLYQVSEAEIALIEQESAHALVTDDDSNAEIVDDID